MREATALAGQPQVAGRSKVLANNARRIEIGESRRARTRLKLLDAACSLFARHGSDIPTIDHVIEESGLSRGTFYNHFSTRDELFAAVADNIATAINAKLSIAMTELVDPGERLALAFRMFARFAVANQSHGWILLRTMPMVDTLNSEMQALIFQEFDKALAHGTISAPSTAMAMDVGLGLLIRLIRRMLAEQHGSDYIDMATETMLIALGVAPGEAKALAHRSIAASLELVGAPGPYPDGQGTQARRSGPSTAKDEGVGRP